MDGRVVASVDYEPLPTPRVGNAGYLYPPQGWVAAGGLYFIDGHGVVRRLDPNGTVVREAQFPVTESQQVVSFVVSPDGGKLGAIIITLPPMKSPPSEDMTVSPYEDGARGSLDLEWANAGGSTVLTLHKDLGTDPYAFEQPTLLEGWDEAGAVATLRSRIAAQSGVAAYPMSGQALVHLGEDGTHLDRLGGTVCAPADELFDGTVLCIGDGGYPKLAVRTASGDQLWSLACSAAVQCENVRLSPSGDRLAMLRQVYFKDGRHIAYSGIPPDTIGNTGTAVPSGWLDNGHVVVVVDGGLGVVDALTGQYRAVISNMNSIFVGALT